MENVKPIIIMIAPDQIDFFGAVLNCAVRYCIGRKTYMPGLVTDWIMVWRYRPTTYAPVSAT